jgi:hypothetical protein
MIAGKKDPGISWRVDAEPLRISYSQDKGTMK